MKIDAKQNLLIDLLVRSHRLGEKQYTCNSLGLISASSQLEEEGYISVVRVKDPDQLHLSLTDMGVRAFASNSWNLPEVPERSYTTLVFEGLPVTQIDDFNKAQELAATLTTDSHVHHTVVQVENSGGVYPAVVTYHRPPVLCTLDEARGYENSQQ